MKIESFAPRLFALPARAALLTCALGAPAVAQAPPSADAGPDQTREAGDWVGLTARSSTDPDSAAVDLTYAWVQLSGPPVTLKRSDQVTAYFRAPAGEAPSTRVFEVTVTDETGLDDTASCTVTTIEAPAQFQGLSTSLGPYRTGPGELTPDEVRHFSERAAFGLSQADQSSLHAMGSAAWVAIQSELDIEADRQAALDDAGIDPKSFPCDDHENARQTRIEDFVLHLAMRSDAQLWMKDWYRTHTLFAVSTSGYGNGENWKRMRHFDALAAGALTEDYAAFLRGITLDPAMLDWLDGINNRGDAPNENFARELLELFTMGEVDPYSGAPNYTETDVQSIARALTGWHPSEEAPMFPCQERIIVFNPGSQATGGPWPVTFDTTPQTVGTLDDVLRAVLDDFAAARFLALDVFQYYAGFLPDEEVADELAAILLQDGGDAGDEPDWNLRSLVETVLLSNAMFSPEARKSQTASPLELVVSTQRKYDGPIGPNAPVRDRLRDMGHQMLAPPSVKGWPDPSSKEWISQGRLIGYMEFVSELARRKQNGTVDLTPFYSDPGLDDACSFAYSLARKWGVAADDIDAAVMDTWALYLNLVFVGAPEVSFDLSHTPTVNAKGMGFFWLIGQASLAHAE